MAIDIPLVKIHQTRIVGDSFGEGLHDGNLFPGKGVDIDFREPGDKGGEGDHNPTANRFQGGLV